MSQKYDHHKTLLEEFPIPSIEAWHAEIDRLLKGASFDAKMRTRTEDGLVLEPLYTLHDVSDITEFDSSPGSPPFVRGRRSDPELDWEVVQDVRAPEIPSANGCIIEGLDGGITAIRLHLDAAGRAGLDPEQTVSEQVGADGVSIANEAEIDRVLRGVDLATTPVYLRPGISALPCLGMIVTTAQRRCVSPRDLAGAVAFDPVGDWVTQGTLPCQLDWAFMSMAEATKWCASQAPGFGTAWVHGETYHEGGASCVQELAFALATGLAYLRELETRGVDPQVGARHLRFSFALGNQFFMEVAKIRAARLLWSRVLEASGLMQDGLGMWILGNTSTYTKTLYDPYVNMLRATTEALSGVVGGVDALQVTPFNESVQAADDFSRRIARNTQTIIRDEAHLGKVMDVAGGSFFVEKLTRDMAQEAWDVFQEVEKRGGIRKALEAGFPQEEVAKVADERRKNLSTGRAIRVGINAYPNGAEQIPDSGGDDLGTFHEQRAILFKEKRSSLYISGITAMLAAAEPGTVCQAVIESAAQGATIGEIIGALGAIEKAEHPIAPIKRHRLTETFEETRTAVLTARELGRDCRVFLVTLGSVARFMPRLDFTTSFFESGGFAVVKSANGNAPTDSIQTALDRAARVVVICGLDEAYPDAVPELAGMAKRHSPDTIVVLAGKPADDALRQSFSDAGVDFMIHRQCDILDILLRIARHVGVEA